MKILELVMVYMILDPDFFFYAPKISLARLFCATWDRLFPPGLLSQASSAVTDIDQAELPSYN